MKNGKLNLKILIVEDSNLYRIGLIENLKDYGIVKEAKDEETARSLMGKESFDMAFIDLDLNQKSLIGYELVKLANSQGIYPVILSGHTDDRLIEDAYKHGCLDFLVKPHTQESLNHIISSYLSLKRKENVRELIFKKYITCSDQMRRNLSIIEDLYLHNNSIYISGPSGTGKQVVAEIIHELAHGNLNHFVDLNCAKVSDNLIESELFGHVKGAFTGANENKIGLLEKANGGTLFLDEIATMSKSMQNKLIKAIETKKFSPLGSTKEIRSNFRLITATSGNLYEEVKKGHFRLDFFYRINASEISLLPLKERKEDIPLLINYFIQNHESRRRIIVPLDVMEHLKDHHWNGNVRELRHLVNSWQMKGLKIVGFEDLPESIKSGQNLFAKETKLLSDVQLNFIDENGFNVFVDEILKEAIPYFLHKNRGKVTRTIGNLGITNEKYYKIMDGVKKKNAI